ncbi:GNAT family N-acetyltransferase [Actinoplanes sp. NPDC023801]|uniref:GNAT family N-acetyltransferase n=1 Tax=Actinoplanes sp. NPDC023801 TaxID=3154595 RepID=UPI00340D043F
MPTSPDDGTGWASRGAHGDLGGDAETILGSRHPDRLFWQLAFEGEPAGFVAYDVHPGKQVEIETFGLVPEFVGRGLGGYALTLTIGKAWELAPGVERIWLHTSSADHPHALPNYHRRGLRTFKTEERVRD